MKALDRAIEIAGGVSKLARRLNIDPSCVSQWRRRKSVPPYMARAIETATGVTRHELRPDVFGDAPAAQAKSAEQASAAA
jgi:DNA-binding transcriptional regulator YdaS (Cro superfamily)